MEPDGADEECGPETELAGLAELELELSPREEPPLDRGLNIYTNPFVPPEVPEEEIKRCTYCLEKKPPSMFSKSQWNAKKTRARYR